VVYIAGEYNLCGNQGIQWGIDHELEAMQCYSDATGNVVEASGLWLSESGCLGASPDGLVSDNIVVEAKCPFTARNTSLVELAQNKRFFLKIEDEILQINRQHDYFHQIQGQMFLSGRTECHLVVWSPTQTIIFIQPREEEWAVNIVRLQTFFEEH
jgi:hypothetical protein